MGEVGSQKRIPWEEFLPVKWEESKSRYVWSNGLRCCLHTLAQGHCESNVRGGVALGEFLSQLADPDVHPQVADGVAHYFNELVNSRDSQYFFEKTLPRMAQLAVSLPRLLVEQIERSKEMAEEIKSTGNVNGGHVIPLPLQILQAQQPGLVLITQELAASLLTCAFFCLFPVSRRDEQRLPAINLDTIFARLWDQPSQVHKLYCLMNYFKRICDLMPQGTISYERKVLALPRDNADAALPGVMEPSFWSASETPLCSFRVMDTGIIEDAGWEYLQVDFANKFLGGGALRLGCVQEEIRFMLSPELVVGMFFLPALKENETIEIVGSERFSNYAGYAAKFHYAGDFVDSTPRDSWGRRRTKIIAMDAQSRPGEKQFQESLLLREACKAYCGYLSTKSTSPTDENSGETSTYKGIATGNWGCGAFGGDLPIKSMLQWLAASQTGWPMMKYYTFQDQRAERLHEAVHHILEKKYDVGQLWRILIKYGELRHRKQLVCNFFDWLLKERVRVGAII